MEKIRTIQDYNDLIKITKHYKENINDLYKKRIELFNFAKRNLLWEKYEKNILNAYQKCS